MFADGQLNMTQYSSSSARRSSSPQSRWVTLAHVCHVPAPVGGAAVTGSGRLTTCLYQFRATHRMSYPPPPLLPPSASSRGRQTERAATPVTRRDHCGARRAADGWACRRIPRHERRTTPRRQPKGGNAGERRPKRRGTGRRCAPRQFRRRRVTIAVRLIHQRRRCAPAMPRQSVAA